MSPNTRPIRVRPAVALGLGLLGVLGFVASACEAAGGASAPAADGGPADAPPAGDLATAPGVDLAAAPDGAADTALCPNACAAEGRQCGAPSVPGCQTTVCGLCLPGASCSAAGRCCTPDCSGRACGDDGCGGSCGRCRRTAQCVAGACVVCTPDCAGRDCGADGCGGVCGTCDAGPNAVCDPLTGQCGCTPDDCAERECGADGCGGSCGECPAGLCVAGACRGGPCWPNCPPRVPVYAASFVMGCDPQHDGGCHEDEQPAHGVAVDDFAIDTTEVTVAAYAACVAGGACTPAETWSPACNAAYPERGDHPVNCVSWQQAFDYCAFANARLCTEAEWELAARSPAESPYPWGDAPPSCTLAVMRESGALGCGADTTAAVGSRPAGAARCGAVDLAGNVWEWVNDYYLDHYVTRGDVVSNPLGPENGETRVRRGGGYDSAAGGLRAQARADAPPELTAPAGGFRCCR